VAGAFVEQEMKAKAGGVKNDQEPQSHCFECAHCPIYFGNERLLRIHFNASGGPLSGSAAGQ
jgi:hypothetical protein